MSFWSFLISFLVTLVVCISIYSLIGVLKKRKKRKNDDKRDDDSLKHN